MLDFEKLPHRFFIYVHIQRNLTLIKKSLISLKNLRCSFAFTAAFLTGVGLEKIITKLALKKCVCFICRLAFSLQRNTTSMVLFIETDVAHESVAVVKANGSALC